jgi:flagellar basal body rod protein FlgG
VSNESVIRCKAVRKGFFTIQIGDEALYTLNGRFFVSDAGILITQAGYSLLHIGASSIPLTDGLIATCNVGHIH